MASKFPPFQLALTVWGLGALFYLIGFFQRVAPAVITTELMTEFSLGAAALGNLSAVYFYSYVGMQIPTGIVVDRWGPRRVLAAGAAVAAAGTLLFALAQSLALVALGRLLIGASVGVAFVAMLKLSTHWFHLSRFAFFSGVALACGVVGAVFAGAPLRLLVDAYGWRVVMIAAGGLTGLLALLIWAFVRDDPQERGYRSFVAAPHVCAPRRSILGGMGAVLRTPNVWLIFIISGGVSGPALTFAGLWGVPFLRTHYGLATATAAMITSLLLLSWALGGPVMGALSDRFRERKPLYGLGAGIAAAGWFIVFLIPNLPLAVLITVLVVTGIASGCIMIGFAFAKESTPAALAGTTSGVINMGNMLGGMIMQPAVGWVLDRYWHGTVEGGARIYGFAAYRAGFSLMLAWLVLAMVLLLFTHETRCRQTP
ncbi:MAG: MFS transporter [Betaproteobacteria bacterium RIFCSPLOWO2_12_FULL_65_110]|nr:MAG: MFS transporter [Betaproteobacteria bacterium RIFCSPLOWO2_12_FULL_65_110]